MRTPVTRSTSLFSCSPTLALSCRDEPHLMLFTPCFPRTLPFHLNPGNICRNTSRLSFPLQLVHTVSSVRFTPRGRFEQSASQALPAKMQNLVSLLLLLCSLFSFSGAQSVSPTSSTVVVTPTDASVTATASVTGPGGSASASTTTSVGGGSTSTASSSSTTSTPPDVLLRVPNLSVQKIEYVRHRPWPVHLCVLRLEK